MYDKLPLTILSCKDEQTFALNLSELSLHLHINKSKKGLTVQLNHQTCEG